MRNVLAVAITLVLLPALALARLEAGAGLSLAWPESDFKDHVEFAWGGGARIGYGIGTVSPVVVTFFGDINYLNYGRERRIEPFSTTIPDVVVDVVTDNYMFMVDPGLSIGLRYGPVRPYGEMSFGLTYIATKTRIENHSIASEPIAESTNFSDFTYNLGLGGGFKIPVWRKNLYVKLIELSEALIDIKFSYLKGGEAEYLKKGSISRQSGQVRYETILSKTDLFQVRIGASFVF